MFDEAQEITFDNNSQLNKSKQMVPPDVQTSINNIVNTNQSDVAKNETKEMIKGGVLGAVIGAILCLYRGKKVWLGVLAGGLAGGYLAKEGIVKISKEKKEDKE
tara:strand:- start:934 stop:1245 length:312 start_codon:yes stop_codon:yes gene_type:complete